MSALVALKMNSPVLRVSVKVLGGGCGDLGDWGGVDLSDGSGVGNRGMGNNWGSGIAVGRSEYSSLGHSGQSGDENNLNKKQCMK